MDEKELEERIEQLRVKLIAIAKEIRNLHDRRVVAISQQLDELIVRRQKLAAGAKK